MSASSPVVVPELNLDNGIYYVKCAGKAAAARNNAFVPIPPISRLNNNEDDADNKNNSNNENKNGSAESTTTVILLNRPGGRTARGCSRISISGDDLAQQQHCLPEPGEEASSERSRRRQLGESSQDNSTTEKSWWWTTNKGHHSKTNRLLKCVWMWSSLSNYCPLSQLSPLSQVFKCRADSPRSSVNANGSVSREENINFRPRNKKKQKMSTGNHQSSLTVVSQIRKATAAATGQQQQTMVPAGGGGWWFGWKLMMLALVLIGVIDYSEAGTCWLRRMESTGKCNKLFARNVTRESCCHAGSALGFSDRDINDVEVFFVNAFNDGMDCGSCLDSCDKAKCGLNKRCIMKKGRPKCVCAPNCKSPKQAKHYQQKQNIKVISLTESQRNRGQYFEAGQQPRVQLAGGSNSKRSVRHPADGGFANSRHNPRTVVKTSISEKSTSQRSSSSSNSNRKDNLFESVTLASSKSRTDSLESNGGGVWPTDRMVLMADSPASLSPSSSSANVRHRNRKVSAELNRTLLDAETATHRGQQQRQHHSRDFGKPRLLRILPAGSGRNVSLTVGRSRQPRQNAGDMFYVGPVPVPHRKNRMHGMDLEFENEITQHHTGYYNPVCGTDGKTYKTECQMKKRACRQERTSLAVAYKGHCQTSCRFVQCPDGKHCIEDQNAMPHCVACAMNCPPVDARGGGLAKSVVCGTDGISYRSVCELKQKACLSGRAIPVAYRGRCVESATCDTIKCKDRQHCLTDLKTHRPRCVSCSYKCPRMKMHQQQQHQQQNRQNRKLFGREAGISGSLGKAPHKGQSVPNIKLCGTNNHTYHSWCHMLRDSCHTGFYIDVQYNGVCSFGKNGMASKKFSLPVQHSSQKP
ncbi:uncharacterized protein LOC129755982 [Uranotaenia lowii]|uniref:uncharacterized protein LOC129755982 n=1 Tax=Uranotaenia lowii TaxID=190385 RepID=UPI002479D224|nr:uncharacterized protein LOC129755982 [Uranotaenia lowii]